MSYEELLIKCDTKNIEFFLIRHNPYQRGFGKRFCCKEVYDEMFQIHVTHSYPFFYYLIKTDTINRLIQTPKYFTESHYEFGKETDMVTLRYRDDIHASITCFEPFTIINSKNLQFIKRHIRKWTKDKSWIELVEKAHG